MKVQALRNTWMKRANVHGFDGKQGTACHGGMYLNVNGWVLVEVTPDEITCPKCVKQMFPVPSLADMEKLEAWVNGKPR